MILENELASTLEEVGFFSGTIESLFAVFAFLSGGYSPPHDKKYIPIAVSK